MSFAREGTPFIIAATAIAALAFVVALAQRSWPAWLLALLLTVVALWVAYFFRDPERSGSRGERVAIAPADGKVVMVTEVDEPTFLQGRAERISIFMNVFDCHVNRYPTDGTVAYRHYNPGEFGHAGAEKASLSNEQSSIGLTTARGKLLVRQIAGLVARRIVTDHQPGQVVHQGDRMGMIRFGSRVDLFLPLGTPVLVHVGDTTLVGVTVVAQWS